MTVLVIQVVFRAYDGLRKQTESSDGLKVQRLLQHRENTQNSPLQKVCYSCQTWKSEKAQHYAIEVNLVQMNNHFFLTTLSILLCLHESVLILKHHYEDFHEYNSKKLWLPQEFKARLDGA